MGGKSFSRRQSRRKAFELLFELEQHAGITAQQILERTFEHTDVVAVYSTDDDVEGYVCGVLDSSSRRFVEELVQAANTHKQTLDLELAKYPHDWSYDRIGVPERVLLRLALAEMVYLGTSHKVVIDEALDMAKMYAQEDARRFINGILGAVMHHLEELKAAAREVQE